MDLTTLQEGTGKSDRTKPLVVRLYKTSYAVLKAIVKVCKRLWMNYFRTRKMCRECGVLVLCKY